MMTKYAESHHTLVWSILFAFFMIACDDRKIEYEYFENGNIKSERKYSDGKLDGEALEYFEDGSLRRKVEWKNGKKDGSFTLYYHKGGVEVKGLSQGERMINLKRFYQDGSLEQEEWFDPDGDVARAVRYNTDGSRDTTAFPIAYVAGIDTVIEYNKLAALKVSVVNFSDSLDYQNGRLIIAQGFDTLNNRITDTVIVLKEKKTRFFEFRFIPNLVGENTMFCEVHFQKELGNDHYKQTTMQFVYQFYVKK